MSQVNTVEDVYSAIEEAAGLMKAACSRDKVVPVLTTWEDILPEAGIILSVANGERHAGELDYTVTVPLEAGDPHARALANGFIEETDHPVGTLLSDVRDRCSVTEHLVDCSAGSGFKKLYALFPGDLQGVAKLADIPSMPAAVGENVDFFTSHGLDDVAMIGVDYGRKTMNLYFDRLSPESLDAKNIRAVVREIGLPEPTEPMVEFAQKSFRVYVTLSWDSSKVDRICYAPGPLRGPTWADPAALPAPIEPEIERFMTSSPYTHAGERIFMIATMWAPSGEYLKVGSYYQVSPALRDRWVSLYREEL